MRAAVVPIPVGRRAGALGALAPTRRSLAVAAVLLAAAGGLYAAARQTSLFAVETVVVRGATPAVARQVRQALAPLAGSSLVGLDAAGAVELAEAVPEVRRAAVDRAFPHALVVTVERERPAAVLRRGAESWLVSARGRILRPLARGAHPRLPRVWVAKDVAVEAGALPSAPGLRRAAHAAGLVPDGFPAAVRTVVFAGGELRFRLGTGIELRLGDGSDLPLKLAVASRVLPDLEPPAAGGPAYLDIALAERPVTGGNPRPEG